MFLIIYLPDQATVLKQFTTQIQRNVFRVDNTLDKSEPFGQHQLGLRLNQDLSCVKRNAGRGIA